MIPQLTNLTSPKSTRITTKRRKSQLKNASGAKPTEVYIWNPATALPYLVPVMRWIE